MDSQCPIAWVPTRVPGGATGTARTTRYADGCKPSCSWTGKALVTRPVVSCSATGCPLASVDTQSGCTGGSAFACLHQHPWAVNDTFALGFAAAKLRGQGEGDWCCACYLLQFMNGPARGKRMAVQVINTGADLSDNHFDLLFPGGGQGAFLGSLAQFPELGPRTWGDRYGGVRDIASCAALPATLRAGCRFRFEWGKGMDNPDASFYRVRCPAALVEATECRRHDEA